jgi:hypothetical protein
MEAAQLVVQQDAEEILEPGGFCDVLRSWRGATPDTGAACGYKMPDANKAR